MRIGSYDAYELPGRGGDFTFCPRESPKQIYFATGIPVEEDLKDYYTESSW